MGIHSHLHFANCNPILVIVKIPCCRGVVPRSTRTALARHFFPVDVAHVLHSLSTRERDAGGHASRRGWTSCGWEASKPVIQHQDCGIPPSAGRHGDRARVWETRVQTVWEFVQFGHRPSRALRGDAGHLRPRGRRGDRSAMHGTSKAHRTRETTHHDPIVFRQMDSYDTPSPLLRTTTLTLHPPSHLIQTPTDSKLRRPDLPQHA